MGRIKVVECPVCNEEMYVGHLAWSALKCVHCKAYVNKSEWTIKKK